MPPEPSSEEARKTLEGEQNAAHSASDVALVTPDVSRNKMSLLRPCWFPASAILLIGLALRLPGVSREARVIWDEGRPPIEQLFENPSEFLIEETQHHRWFGRPMLLVFRVTGFFVTKVLTRLRKPGFPQMCVPFQLLLDLASMLVIMDLVRRWVVRDGKQADLISLLAGLIWATSPTLIRYSHRMLPPVYALFMFTSSCWLLLWALDRGKAVRFWVAGLAFGAAFMTYPALYHVILFSPLLLLDARHRRQISLRQVLAAGVGFATLPLTCQAAMLPIKVWVRPDYITYLDRLLTYGRDLSDIVIIGSLNENAGLPFRFAWASSEYWLIAVLPLVLRGALVGQRSTRPWCLWAIAVYCLWVANGPVLRREVLYARIAVLPYPLLMVAAVASLAELLRGWVWPGWVTVPVMLAAALASGTVLAAAPSHRTQVEQVRSDAAGVLGVPGDRVAVLLHFNDYGLVVAQQGWAGLADKISRALKAAGNRTTVVAFNLRALNHPICPRIEFPLQPILRYPAAIREPYFRFEGHTRAERAYIARHPSLFDIKVYLAKDILSCEPKVITASEMLEDPPKWLLSDQP